MSTPGWRCSGPRDATAARDSAAIHFIEMRAQGVVAADVEIVEIALVEAMLAAGDESAFTPGELAFARARSDPARRLAARLAAKRVACRLLGSGIAPQDIEVLRSEGAPPRLSLSPRAQAALDGLGGASSLVSLTHERRHAAASVVLLAP